uniref:Uncharacterized protein n=1 Tax=Anguilla anguilla TaxID=7936 RepID=A0A0E9S2V2_ANGAN
MSGLILWKYNINCFQRWNANHAERKHNGL